MAKDTVERILQAEAAAVTVTEQAKAKAEKLVMNAQGKSELVMNDAKRALKTYEDEKQAEIAQYSLSAMEKAEELCAAQKADLDERAAKNRATAVKAAMDILV